MRVLLLILLVAGVATTAGERALAEDMPSLHNQLRTKLKLKPLAWSERIAFTAQDWANTLLLTGRFAHRPKNRYGENLYEVRGSEATSAEAFQSWASEAAMYDYKTNTCHYGGPCGHYTQIVWRNTRELGCGVARSPSREVWVCNYNPPGNYAGQRPY